MSCSDSPRGLKGSLLQGHEVDPGQAEDEDKARPPARTTRRKDRVCLEQRLESKIDTLTLPCHNSLDLKDTAKAVAGSQHPHFRCNSPFIERKEEHGDLLVNCVWLHTSGS